MLFQIKRTVTLAAITVFAALAHATAIFAAMALGLGPWGRALALVSSGAMDSYSERATTAWFVAAEQSVRYERFVIWPAVLLMAAALCIRFVRPPRAYYGAFLALACIPSILGTDVPRLSHIAPTYVAYAVLTSCFCGALNYLFRTRFNTSAT